MGTSEQQRQHSATVQAVLHHARGLAEGMSKSEAAVAELVNLAKGRRDILEAAQRLAEGESRRVESRDEPVSVEADLEVPEATAVLAGRLLREAAQTVRA